MKSEAKQKGQSQIFRSKQVKQSEHQDNEDFELKMKKIQKEIVSLNQDINSLLQQRNFKQKTQKALLKQRKKLENCFLLKDLQGNKLSSEGQISEDIENEVQNFQLSKPKVKNHFRDVNETILRFIKQLQKSESSQLQKNLQNGKVQTENEPDQKQRKLECQSLHLKQIFNPEQSSQHEAKALRLQTKLGLLYEKIQLNLERQEPYLHEKIVERIKRQAQSYTRKKLSQQIDRMIKENSKWITQETNRVNNQLEEKKVEEICVNNLGLMKKIMNKKVANNDWIYENYSEAGTVKGSTLGFPVQKISKQYSEVLKRLQEKRIANQLQLVSNQNIQKDSRSTNSSSLKQLLGSGLIKNLVNKKEDSEDMFQEGENDLLSKADEIHKKIESLIRQ